jgi:PKD repeat protein
MVLKNKIKLITLLLLFPFFKSFSQCMSTDFNLVDTVCMGADLTYIDMTSSVENYEWDFYGNDFNIGNPVPVNMGNVAGLIADSWGMSMAEDSLGFYAFISLKTANKLLRVDFNQNLDTNLLPNLTDLGNPFNELNSPKHGPQIYKNRMFTTSGTAYASYKIIQYVFDNGFSNPPDTALTFQNTSTTNYEIKSPKNLLLREENDSLYVFCLNTNYISVLNYGVDVNAQPFLKHKIENLNGFSNSRHAKGFDIIKICNNWIGYALLNNNEISILNFGNSLQNLPTITNIGNPLNALSGNNFNLRAIAADGEIHLFIQKSNGDLFKISMANDGLGNNLNVKTFSNSFGSGSVISFDMIRNNSSWYAFAVNRSSNSFYKLRFLNNNNLSSSLSNNGTLTQLPYLQAGKYYVSLTGKDSLGSVSSSMDSIILLNAASSDFTYANQCVNPAIDFQNLTNSNGLLITDWKWKFGDNDSSTLENPSHSYLASDTFSVSLEVTTVNGCKSIEESSIYFTDIKPENPDFGYSPNKICANSTIQFVDLSSTALQDSVTSLFWQFGDGDTSSLLNPQHVYSSQGMYDVSLTVTGKHGCDTTIIKTINVIDGPSPSLSFDNLCLNDTTFFTDLSSVPSPSLIVSWNWKFSSIDSSSNINAQYVFDSTGIHHFSLDIKTDSSCFARIDTFLEIVKPPELNFTTDVYCLGDSIGLNGNSSDSIIQWAWLINDVIHSSNENDVFFPENTNDLVISLIGGNNLSCFDTLRKTVEVFPALTADFSYTNNCIGDSISFIDETQSLSIVNWNWTFNGFNYSDLQHSKFQYNSLGVKTVDFEIENALGCKSAISKNIEISPQPIALFGFDKACMEDTTLFFDESTVLMNSIISNTWQIESNAYSGDSISYVFSEEDHFDIHYTISTENGCSDDTIQTISINPLPIPDFDFTPDYGSAPIEISFTNQTSDAIAYNWTFGDEGSSNDENPQHTYVDNDIYNVTLKAINEFNCEKTKTQEIAIIPSDLDIELKNLVLDVTNNGSNNIVNASVLMSNVGTRYIANVDLILRLNNGDVLAQKWNGSLNIGTIIDYNFDAYFIVSDLSRVKYICVEAVAVNDGSELNLVNNKTCKLMDGNIQFSTPYPNPVDNFVNIDVVTNDKGVCNVAVVNLLGEILYSKKVIDLQKGYNQLQIETATYQSGKYFLKLTYLEEDYLHSFVVK